MANINELLARAAALRDETALNSISPERAGGIMYDTLVAMNELWLQQGAALVISKIYASVAAMEADTEPVSDLTGQPLRPGQIVVIASSDSDNGSVYRYNGTESPSWTLVGSIGNLEPVDSLDSDSTSLPLAAHQGKVLDGKISQLGQEVDELAGYTFSASEVANFAYANTSSMDIPQGVIIKNNGIQVMLYAVKDDGSQILLLPANSTIKTDHDYHWIRAWSSTGDVSLNILGMDAAIKDYVYDNFKPYDYNLLYPGRINNKVVQWISGYHRTRPLPIIEGCGYVISGATSATFDYYTTNVIDASSYISGGLIGVAIPATAKYVVISFDDNDVADYDNLSIKSLSEIVSAYNHAPFSLQNKNLLSATLEKYSGLCNGIRWMRFFGTSYDSTKTYSVQFIKSGSSIRVVVYDGATAIYDNTFVQDGDSPISETYENSSGYSLSIIADLNDTPDIEENTQFLLNGNAFNSAMPMVQGSDSQKFSIDGASEVLDYSRYFEAANGGAYGYVLSSDGTQGSASNWKVTDFLPTEGIMFVKAYTPVGSGAGLAFYDAGKNAISDYQGTGKAGYASNEGGVSYYGVWKEVPENAAYFRVTCDYATNHELYVIRKVLSSSNVVIDAISDRPTPRSTKVVWGYEDFGMSSARQTIEQATFNEDARQIVSKYEHYTNRSSFEVSFSPADNNVNIGIGCEYALMSEVRVSGNTFSIRCGSSANDTYINIPPVVIFSYTLPFSLEVGKTYKLGYIKRDASLINNAYEDNATFYIDDFAGNRYEKTIERTAPDSEYNNVPGRYSTMLLGKCFVSVKQGEVEINNVSFASDYNPRAKCLLTGDSFVAGDTMTSEGQRYKYAALLQQAIGMDDFVIVGKGGEMVSESWIIYITETIRKYCPEYVIIALSCNNYVLSVYEDLMTLVTDWLVKVGIKPVLVTITPYKYGDNTDYRGTFRVSANNWVRNSGYRYVDICKAVTVSDGTAWKDGLVLSDGVHPSKAGHQVIFETFEKELPELFME